VFKHGILILLHFLRKFGCDKYRTSVFVMNLLVVDNARSEKLKKCFKESLL